MLRGDDAAANLRSMKSITRATASFAGAPSLGAAGGAALVGSWPPPPARAPTTSDTPDGGVDREPGRRHLQDGADAPLHRRLGGQPGGTKFAQVTMGQHAQHADAFNAAVKHLGGKAQTKPDPAFVPVVNKAWLVSTGARPPRALSASSGLAIELENIAAETYVKDTTLAKSTTNKALFASIMGIEAQHVAVLLAVQALLMASAPQLISLPPGTAAAARGGRQRRLPQRLLPDQQCRPGQPRSRQVSKNTDEETFAGTRA